jgi:trehalose-6-phosphate synthase
MMSQDGPYKAYKALNQQFADTIVENYKEGDISKFLICWDRYRYFF